MALSLRALGAVGVLALLTACGTTPPVGVPSSPVAPATSSGPSTEPSPSPSASDSPSATARSSSPSVSPTASASPSASAVLVLQPKGVDQFAFGTAEATVTAALNAKAGKADESYSGKVCEVDGDTPYGRQLLYGAGVFLFQSKARGTKNSPRTFTSWVVNLDQPLGSTLRLADGYPVDTTFAKLKTAFPKGKLRAITLGESSVWVFTTPSGLWYRGDDNKTPTDVGAGAMGTCE
ncbi:MAG TPA: hypothetical protein PLF56_02075 [Micropruina sp.]|nr:hypothetical protein [Micropruina sp.]